MEDYDVTNSVRWQAVEDGLDEVGFRVEHHHAVAGGDVLQRQVRQRVALAGTSRAEQMDVVQGVTDLEGQRAVGAGVAGPGEHSSSRSDLGRRGELPSTAELKSGENWTAEREAEQANQLLNRQV